MRAKRKQKEQLEDVQERKRDAWQNAREWFDGEGLTTARDIVPQTLVGPMCSGPPLHSEWYEEAVLINAGVAERNPWYHSLRGVKNRDLDRMREFTKRIVMKGETIKGAAAAVGWTHSKGAFVCRKSPVFQRIRAELLKAGDESIQSLVEEIKSVEFDTAHVGALRRNEIVHDSKDEILAAKVAADALDRIGLKAPTKVDQTFHVELDDESRLLLSRMLGASLPDTVATSEFSYAQRTAKQLLIETNAADAARAELPVIEVPPNAR